MSREYEDAEAHINETSPQQEVQKQRSRRLSVKSLIIIGLTVTCLVSVLTIFGIKLYLAHKPIVKISPDLRETVGLIIIMPSKLPAGFSVSEQPNYDSKTKLLLTRFTDKNGSFIAISQQKKPDNVSLKEIDTQETFLTNIGTAYLLKGEKGRLQAIIETADSWTYVDASSSLSITTVKGFINNLETYK